MRAESSQGWLSMRACLVPPRLAIPLVNRVIVKLKSFIPVRRHAKIKSWRRTGLHCSSESETVSGVRGSTAQREQQIESNAL